jgi:DNA-directed RNA polymerase subunit RPC12/RpoP
MCVLAAILGAIKYRQWAARPKGDSTFHFKCPKCKQRLGYRTAQVGHKGACPRCRSQFVFPVPKPDDVTPR